MLIRQTSLSARAVNALTSAGFDTVESCLELRPDKILAIRNLGKLTAAEIIAFLRTYKESHKEPPVKEDPQERSKYLTCVLVLPISDLPLSERARNVLNEMKIKWLRDLVLEAPERILEQPNSGKKTLSALIDLLTKLNLTPGMQLKGDLKDEINRIIKSSKETEPALKKFQDTYPNEAKILKDINIQVLSKSKADYYIKCSQLYKEGGTLEYVGKKMGITRERVRQILVKGTKHKLFEYAPRNYVFISKDKLTNDIIRFQSMQKVAEENKVALGYLKRILFSYGLTEAKIESLVFQGQKEDIKSEYIKIKDELGRYPTTTDLYSHRPWRALEARIRRAWKTFGNFKTELDIPASKPFVEAVRPWLEERMRIAMIKRMQDLDTIRDIFLEADTFQTGVVARRARITNARAFHLIQILMRTGEVVREGIGSQICYRLVNNKEMVDENYCEDTPSN